ncbi:MAG TPA: RluA family pseudouridine synthase [Myxococcota bacterium]|nr:RluA family pseudouridine synthase [Myxococcota bacterium]
MRPGQEPPTPENVTALYCDDDVLILDKPSGLPVHPSSRYLHGTVVGRLRQHYGEGFAAPVHRLDRETSGVLVCARHRDAARALAQAFGRGQVRKEYVAICEGAAGGAAPRVVDAPIAVGAQRIRIGARVDPEAGRPARTHLWAERDFVRDGTAFSLWLAVPVTGRRHQIRVHLKWVGFPVVGDKIYGPEEALYERFCDGRLSPVDVATLRLPRQALHAAAVTLPHPGNGTPMRFEAPLAPDLRAFAGLAGATTPLLTMPQTAP